MRRARRARRIAAAAAYGSGLGVAGMGAAGLVGYGVLKVEARIARRTVGKPFEGAPNDTDVYGTGHGPEIRLLVLGDSLAAGMGADSRFETIGGILAVGIAALAGRPVHLTNVTQIGAEASWLAGQVDSALAAVPEPHVAVVTVGGNDTTHMVDRADSVADLTAAVRRLRAAGAEVVVGTCPDLGTIEPVPQPLRSIMRHLSRDLAAAQTVACVEAGARTVSLGDLLAPDFLGSPDVMFSKDRFHPSAAGYARAAAALLPSVCAALRLWPGESERGPDRLRGEEAGPVALVADRAVREPGTEVSAAEAPPGGRRRHGRWAQVLRRRRPDGPPLPEDLGEDASEDRSEDSADRIDPRDERAHDAVRAPRGRAGVTADASCRIGS